MAPAVNGTWNHATRLRWQQHLKARGFYTGYLDGDFGSMSRKAAQRDLKSRGYYTGLIDGDFGIMSRTALHFFLYQHWGSHSFLANSHQSQYYVTPWTTGDTVFRIEVVKALQDGLRRHFGK